jgi:hypothetical protein
MPWHETLPVQESAVRSRLPVGLYQMTDGDRGALIPARLSHPACGRASLRGQQDV